MKCRPAIKPPMSYTLKPNSIPDEYYCGDLPGILQYNKDPAQLASIVIPETPVQGDWQQMPCADDLRAALLPHTKSPSDWKLLMVIQRTASDNSIWMKGALLNTLTGGIALMTSCNSSNAITSRGNRPIKSNDQSWYIGHYRMGAPLYFWSELAKICSRL